MSEPRVPRPHLGACPGCGRHVRVTEAACPFCGLALGDAFHATPAPVALSVRLSRAALVALGTGTLSLAAPACGAATAGLFPLVADAGDDSGEGDTGTSPPLDASQGFDVGTIVPPYGLPPPPPEDAGIQPPPPVDASRPDVVIAPPYGAPPYGQAPVGEDD